MNDFISRLICTGMPRCTAISVCRQIKRDQGVIALAQYVDAVEAECDGSMADV